MNISFPLSALSGRLTFDEARTRNTNATIIRAGLPVENTATSEMTFGDGRALDPFFLP